MPALGSNPGQAANVQHKEGASAPFFILDASSYTQPMENFQQQRNCRYQGHSVSYGWTPVRLNRDAPSRDMRLMAKYKLAHVSEFRDQGAAIRDRKIHA